METKQHSRSPRGLSPRKESDVRIDTLTKLASIEKRRNRLSISVTNLSNTSQNDLFNDKEEREMMSRIEKLVAKEEELKNRVKKNRNNERLRKINSITSTKNGFKIKLFPNENNIYIYRRMEQLNYFSPYYDIYESLVDGWRCIAKAPKTSKELKLFKNEIEIYSKFPPHPSILHNFFSTKLNDTKVSFYEFKSKNLKKELERMSLNKKKFTVGEIAEIALQIAKGIHYLHDHNIVLRDFNSSKVWVDLIDQKICIPVIADFTVAFNISDSNRPNDFVGTLGFIAPEVFASKSSKREYTKEIDSLFFFSFNSFILF